MIVVAMGIVAVACLVAGYRMLVGPTDADRAVAADLFMFGIVGLLALFGVWLGNRYTFDIVLVAALLGFLGALSLARALTRGTR
ncbi:monovalent cation/H+ antiporter complex subunit F [Millisia brevis]|uniref:monovalent cation/H+ antiporter complex subunit F n=1 Tax=Millisia brevis TaxID=264148 RepID=UPI000829557B|nr:monovalent cation/H+ antiporter complex subunit F [Millisia brevis]